MRFNLKQLFDAGLKSFNFGGNGGISGSSDPFGGFFNTLPGATYQYGLDAVCPWDNGVVLSGIKWISNAYPEGVLTLQQKIDGTWKIVDDHPALDLLQHPNPNYDQSLLWSGLILSMITDGNGYLFVNTNYLDEPTELYFMPNFQVKPKWVRPTDYISYYEYNTGGQAPIQKLDPKHVVHMRDGLNPTNTRMGLSPLGAVLREICTDNEVATMAAAYARQAGMPGLVLTPKDEVEIDQTQRQMLRKSVHEQTTGDNRFRVMLMNIPMEISTVQWSPEQMAFDKQRHLPEARICSAMGLNPIVLSLSSGMENSTYANYEEARKAAYETCMMSVWRRFSQQLTVQLLPKFGLSPREWRYHFDVSEVRALSENENDRHQRIREDFQKGIIKRSEARAETGRDFGPEDEIYIEQLPRITERIDETENIDDEKKSSGE